MKPKEAIRKQATVIEPLPNELYRVELEDSRRLVAHVSARRNKDFLRLLPGDRVEVELSPLDFGRGRVVRRMRGVR